MHPLRQSLTCLAGTGVRSVEASCCSDVTEVAVDCRNYKISNLRWSKWRSREVPGTGFEDLVVESCVNVLGASKPTYADPISSDTGRVIEASSTKPVETGSLEQRYRDAIYSQQEWLRRLQGR